jgi:thiamine biosynthesis protein ThiS
VTIRLNGEPQTLAGPMTILALLEQLRIDPRLVAVEHNRLVIKRSKYGDVHIYEGSEIEIVSFVGGG